MTDRTPSWPLAIFMDHASLVSLSQALQVFIFAELTPDQLSELPDGALGFVHELYDAINTDGDADGRAFNFRTERRG